MSTITFSGLTSGIDTGSMIEQLVSLERAPIRRMETERKNYQSQLKIVQNINSKLQALQNKAQDLKAVGDVLSYTATSTDDDEVSATASGSASPGVYKINVTNLALADRWYSDPFDDKDVAGEAGSGTLTIDLAAEDAVEVEIEATDTLEDIVAKINSSDAKVSAGLLYTEAGYKIQVNADETGEDNAITFTEDAGLLLDLDDVSNRYQQAENAAFTVDGFAVTSQSNEIDDVIAGVTISLLEENAVDVEIKIEPEPTAIKDKLKEFVDSYNEVMSIIHDEMAFNGEAKGDDRLAGDSTLRSIQSNLGLTISSSISGLGGSYAALSQVGISTNKDGSLAIDDADLEAAIAADPVGVAELFAGTSDHSVDGIADQIDDLVESFIDFSDGMLTAKKEGINRLIRDINDSIDRKEDHISTYEQKLIRQFTDMEIAMSNLTSQSSFLASQGSIW